MLPSLARQVTTFNCHARGHSPEPVEGSPEPAEGSPEPVEGRAVDKGQLKAYMHPVIANHALM